MGEFHFDSQEHKCFSSDISLAAEIKALNSACALHFPEVQNEMV